MNAHEFNTAIAKLTSVEIRQTPLGLQSREEGFWFNYDPYNDLGDLFKIAYKQKVLSIAMLANENDYDDKSFNRLIDIIRDMLLERANGKA